MSLILYRPTETDLTDINELILSAKRSWNYPEHLIELWKPDMFISSDTLDEQEFWIARNETEELVYVYSISQQTKAVYELNDCWVAPQFKGQGYGKDLFTHLLQTLSCKNAETLVIVSDPNAEGFYKRMGASKVGEHTSKPEGRMLPVLELQLKADNIDNRIST